ncbi:hypothetical protein KIN20_033134 [Parelaphostrongylus tenuis]|uniref:Uncharacterized protein n=1 Tax=Parelaphostrongylus tenuis TaxID=148309 RepID=A0AAD5R824_PARTN|nr:hypothetical protein KIN20_033134 [Parelaphostrongylus tenuis]
MTLSRTRCLDDVREMSLPHFDIDMVIATPCNNLAVMSTIDESTALFVPLHQSIKKDPTRFKLTEEEQIYWTILRHAHSTINNGGLRGLEELQYVDPDVQDNLEKLANEKPTDEAAAISQQRKNQKEKNDPLRGNIIAMIGNRMGMLQIVATKGGDDEDMEMIEITSRRNQILLEEFQVKTSIDTLSRLFQPNLSRALWQTHNDVSVRKLRDGEHSHGGILFEYKFFANVIEIRETASWRELTSTTTSEVLWDKCAINRQCRNSVSKKLFSPGLHQCSKVEYQCAEAKTLGENFHDVN